MAFDLEWVVSSSGSFRLFQIVIMNFRRNKQYVNADFFQMSSVFALSLIAMPYHQASYGYCDPDNYEIAYGAMIATSSAALAVNAIFYVIYCLKLPSRFGKPTSWSSIVSMKVLNSFNMQCF